MTSLRIEIDGGLMLEYSHFLNTESILTFDSQQQKLQTIYSLRTPIPSFGW